MQPDGLEKHSRPGVHGSPIELEAYMADPRLCPAFYLKVYIERTKEKQTSDFLFIIMRAPHSPASPSTIVSWVAKVIAQSGQSGTGGSVRSTSTSRALSRGADLHTVLSAGDWARVTTFRKYYYKAAPLSFLTSVLH